MKERWRKRKTLWLAALCLSPVLAQAQSWEEHLREGDRYSREENTVQALRSYEQALREDTLPVTVRRTAQCHFKRGDYKACLRLLSLLPPDSIARQDIRLRANSYLRLQQEDSAAVCQRQIAEEYIADSENITALARYYNGRNQPDSALHYTLRYNEVDSTHIIVNRQQAYAHYKAGRYEEALREYIRLRGLGDESVSTFYYMGLCSIYCNNLIDGRIYLKEAAERDGGKSPSILSELGIAEVKVGYADDGVKHLQRALELYTPDDKLLFTLHNTLATGYLRLQQYDDCIRELKACQPYNRQPLYTLFRIAQAYGQKGDAAQEKLYYTQFLQRAGKLPAAQREEMPMPRLMETAEERLREMQEEEFFREGK